MGKGNSVARIITDFSVGMRLTEYDKFTAAHSVNLSETGVCLQLTEPLEIGQQVQLRIIISTQTACMIMSAKVVWVRQDPVNETLCYGLGFVDPDPDQVGLIQFYVQAGTKILLNFFSEFPLFEALTLEDCQHLIRITTRRELAKREILYYEDSRDSDMQGLFIVQSGLLTIFKGKNHDPQRQIAVVSPGQVFGEYTLVLDQPHTATVMAVNASTLIQINKKGLQYLNVTHPSLALKFMEIVARTLATRLGRATRLLFSPLNVGR
jgi:hypothetical protein